MSRIEVKASEVTRSKSLYYFKEKLKVRKAVQLVMAGTKATTNDEIFVVNVVDWLSRKLEEEF